MDHFRDGVLRVQRALSRDGLGELGIGLMFLLAAALPLLKLWFPDGGRVVALAWIAFTWVALSAYRHLSARVRRSIAPARGGYVAPPRPQAKHMAVLAVFFIVLAIVVRGQWLAADGMLVLIGLLLGGFELLKGCFTGVRRVQALGALSIVLAAGIAATGLPFLTSMTIWALLLAAAYGLTGAWVLRGYLGGQHDEGLA